MRQRGVLAWFAGNHVAANLLMGFLLVAGLLAGTRTVIEVFPEISTDLITISVPYRGAAPDDVEEGVVLPIEEAVADIDGVDRIKSRAAENSGLLTIELDEDADERRVLDDVKAAIDRLDTLPDEADKPVVAEALVRRHVISLVLHGGVDEALLKELAENLRDDLTAGDDISEVDIAGTRRYEISVDVDEETLERYGLTLAQIGTAIRRSARDVPGGTIETQGGTILLRGTGQRYRARDFEDIVVLGLPDGTRLHLGDVAQVRDTFEETDQALRLNGERAVSLRVFRVGRQSALEVADAVKRFAAAKTPLLPPGVSLDVSEDQSRILRSRLGLLLRNAAIGLVLVFMSLALFLDLRLAFWTTMGIPISFLGGLWLLPHLDVTINMVSLFAFIVALGIVVDDAIVVGENIYAKVEAGLRPYEAAVAGVREMAMPVAFAVLTTVAAFGPLIFTQGQMGKIMRNIPLVVVSVLLISLTEALLILPAHLSGHHRVPRWLAWLFGPLVTALDGLRRRTQRGLDAFIQGPYRRTLEWVLHHRYTSLALGIALLLWTVGYVAGGFIRFTFFPKVDSDYVLASLTMQEGTPIAETRAALRRLEEALEEVRRELDGRRGADRASSFRQVLSSVGEQPFSARRSPHSTGSSAQADNLGEVMVELLPSEEREFTADSVVRAWEDRLGELPGVKELTFSAELISSGAAISVELAHRDPQVLLDASRRLEERLVEYPGVSQVRDDYIAGQSELSFELTEAGQAAGLHLEDVALQVRHAFFGFEADRLQRGRDDVRVMVRYPENRRQNLVDLDQLRIRLPDGTELPFRRVARTHRRRSYGVIRRADRRRVLTVSADVDEALANANDINDDLRRTILPQLVHDLPGLVWSMEGEQRQQAESLASLRSNFLLALLLIFALLAIPFKSYAQPLIVMSAIPFGLIGAVAGHVLMGLNLSLLSMFGLVALTGVVVNDSLIMVDLVNRERAEGIPLREVVRDAGTRRFRPILLTTMTTFLGLTPMILERSMQARFLIPMAVSLGFGVAFATAITLLLVPALYLILDDLHRLARRD